MYYFKFKSVALCKPKKPFICFLPRLGISGFVKSVNVATSSQKDCLEDNKART